MTLKLLADLKFKSKLPQRAFLLLFLCTVPLLAYGQMFSVDNSDGDPTIPGIGIYVGLEPISFEHQGDQIDEIDAGLYSFSGTLFRLLLEGPGLSLYVGTGGGTTGLDDETYFDAGIEVGYGFSVYRTSNVSVKIPAQIHSTITRVTNDNVVVPNFPEFDQGTLELAAGADIDAKLARQFRLSANVMPSYGFSFSTRQRDANGSILGLEGEARFYFDELFGSVGLSLGYEYNYRKYDVSGNRQLLDYNATAHSILVGITF